MKTKQIRYQVVGAVVALALGVSPLAALKVQADEWPFGRIGSLEPVSGALGADDSDVALVIRYVGTGSGKVAVAANGDITFTSGTEGSEAADTTFECPVSGALGGVIDVSDTACDTLGEVVDTINGSCTGCLTTNWRAVILDGKRADSSNDTLLTISATAATAANGLNINWDTDVAFKSTIALVPPDMRKIGAYLEGTGNKLPPNPFAGTRTAFILGNNTSTYGSGTSIESIESCAETLKLGATGAETCTTLYSVTAGNTATNKVYDYTPYGIVGYKDQKLIVRTTNSAAMSSSSHYAYGMSWYYR